MTKGIKNRINLEKIKDESNKIRINATRRPAAGGYDCRSSQIKYLANR
jgi:hypothetical protein